MRVQKDIINIVLCLVEKEKHKRFMKQYRNDHIFLNEYMVRKKRCRYDTIYNYRHKIIYASREVWVHNIITNCHDTNCHKSFDSYVKLPKNY